jgi:hypothetical protein
MGTMRALGVAIGALVLAAAPAAAAAPGSASQAPTRDLPVAGPLPVVPEHVADRVIAGGTVRASSALVRAARTRSYRTADGQRVEVAVSASYPEDTTADKAIVDFLDTRAHGRELSAIRLFVGRPAEVAALCGGGGVVACYATSEQRMYVPGEDTPEVPMEYVITHEYGHHLASWRRNDPWDALDWGPKRWASAVGVCAGVKRHQLFPGNQGRHYFDDPGEGFADGYAHMHYPQESWRYNPLMRPDERVFDAIRQDISTPWTGPRTRVLHGRRAGTLRLRLTLDGEVGLRLAAPRGSRYELRLSAPGWRARHVLRGGGRIGAEVCRASGGDAQTLSIDVRRISGSGPFALTARHP